ncbi:GNAT family N-acetyltransferase [Gordonia sp. X0973]|uniref:GNAT family N-acetyltransferase n=1 Tax=Gordonia sp. X0973 TaxID=2742602 RepID=UPI000F52966A|nr:GNAT family N-acetyltransferase [Gordonia sp. X0973]QKT07951.1 GNAT family N-acetyltransferase [Gordonia sp. X0973]
MRLTNVAHLRLPFGRLMGYDVTVSEPGAALPVSFDQGRHVAAGDRAGSWMALSFRLTDPVPRESLAAAWLAVIARHGTLRTVFTPGDDGQPELSQVRISPGGWVEHPIAAGEAVNDALRDVLDEACSSYSRPAHRLCVLETAAGPTIVVAADHSHVDMWSMLVILRDFLTALGRIESGASPELDEVPAFVEHTRALIDRPTAPEDVRSRWAAILADCGDVMPLFPLPLGTALPHAERVEVRDVFDVDDSAAFSAQAREDGVSTLALAVSAMTAVTREMAGAPLRAVFPVHSRYDETWHDSVGWFITNSVIESADPAPAACADAVREAVRLGSWPLADILVPWGGMPEAPGMFAISWLDLRRLPVRVDTAGLDAQYVGATIRTDGVMLWFILDGSGLHLRCRYPDTPEARVSVGGWLDLLVAKMQAGARSSVGGVVRNRDGEEFRIQRATRADVPAIVALLHDDEVGRTRETDELARYEAAYDELTRDRSHYLAVVRSAADDVVGTMQLTVLPGLTRAGTTRLQIEGVRVAAAQRSRGLGAAMLSWAHQHGRSHGATLAQLTTDEVRERARSFYARNGYSANHIGLKRDLS